MVLAVSPPGGLALVQPFPAVPATVHVSPLLPVTVQLVTFATSQVTWDGTSVGTMAGRAVRCPFGAYCTWGYRQTDEPAEQKAGAVHVVVLDIVVLHEAAVSVRTIVWPEHEYALSGVHCIVSVAGQEAEPPAPEALPE